MIGPACPCGKSLLLPDPEAGPSAEIARACGRLLDLERVDAARLIRRELLPERSVPVAGFSLELRQRFDAQRWWFEIHDVALRRSIVHIVFSPGLGSVTTPRSSTPT